MYPPPTPPPTDSPTGTYSEAMATAQLYFIASGFTEVALGINVLHSTIEKNDAGTYEGYWVVNLLDLNTSQYSAFLSIYSPGEGLVISTTLPVIPGDTYMFQADVYAKATGHNGLVNMVIEPSLSSVDAAPVPEPSTLLLLGSGLIGLVGYGRRKFFKK